MKIAVIGCGKQGARHLVALRGLADLVAADLDADRAGAVAARVGARAAPSVDTVLADPGIAAVAIAVPTPAHLDLTARAIAAGKHVLCEKPFGADARAARRIADAAARRGLVARVGYLYRFAPAIAAARDAMDRLGAIESAHFTIAATGNHAAWKHRRATAGGVINELVSHMADLALWFFGPMHDGAVVEKRRAAPCRVVDGVAIAADADDQIIARLISHGGVAVTIAGDFTAPRFSQELTIRGARGEIRASIAPNPMPASPPDLYRRQAESFLAAIAQRDFGPDPACDFSAAADVSALLETLHAAPLLAAE